MAWPKGVSRKGYVKGTYVKGLGNVSRGTLEASGVGGGVGTPPPVSGPLEHTYQTVPGHFWYQQAYQMLLDEVAERGKPAVWVEVGVLEGQALCWLGVEVVNRGLPVTIVAVDSFAGWAGTKRGPVLYEAFLKNTETVRGALGERFRVIPEKSVVASGQFRMETVDVVWLDGSHEHDAVRQDLAAWYPTVKRGGVIGGDDWMFPGVKEAVTETGKFMLIPGTREGMVWPSWIRRKPA